MFSTEGGARIDQTGCSAIFTAASALVAANNKRHATVAPTETQRCKAETAAEHIEVNKQPIFA